MSICLREFIISKLLEKKLIPFVGFLLLFGFSWFLLSGKALYALSFGGVFVLFCAEHVFNFINRTKVRGIRKLSGTIVQRPISFLLPLFILLCLFCTFGI